jgi:hypothetical protein
MCVNVNECVCHGLLAKEPRTEAHVVQHGSHLRLDMAQVCRVCDKGVRSLRAFAFLFLSGGHVCLFAGLKGWIQHTKER